MSLSSHDDENNLDAEFQNKPKVHMKPM